MSGLDEMVLGGVVTGDELCGGRRIFPAALIQPPTHF